MPGSSRWWGRSRRSRRSGGSRSPRFPNVKPTTDIVLVSGYALGGGPGFAVGAVAGLTSNFFFGQGPWTPWQMAGWGSTGVIGAGLAGRPGGGSAAGRWRSCASWSVSGLPRSRTSATGSPTATTASGHSACTWGRGSASTSSTPRGCFVFALAFGPALIHSLTRFRTRLNVTWVSTTPLLAIAVVTLAGTAALEPGWPAARWAGGGARGGGDRGRGARGGREHARRLSARGPELGRWHRGDAGPASNSCSRGGPRSAWPGRREPPGRRAGRSQPDRLLEGGVASASDPGDVERKILVVPPPDCRATASGARPRRRAARRHPPQRFGRRPVEPDVVRDPGAARRGRRAAGGALAWLSASRTGDGGFNFATRGDPSDVDDTGAALEALAAAARRAPGRGHARSRSIRGQQDRAAASEQPGAGRTPSRRRRRPGSDRGRGGPARSIDTAPHRRSPTCAR